MHIKHGPTSTFQNIGCAHGAPTSLEIRVPGIEVNGKAMRSGCDPKNPEMVLQISCHILISVPNASLHT